jgi:hypothetical protein
MISIKPLSLIIRLLLLLHRSTENGNSEAIVNGISSLLDAFVEEAIGRPVIDLTSETPRNEISEVDASDSVKR